MGLDVSLQHCEDLRAARALEKQVETETEALWGGRRFESYSESERQVISEKSREIRKQRGLDEYGSSASIRRIQKDSEIHPDHMFKVGYWRSSYNESGINRVLSSMGIHDLSGIVGVDDDEYDVFPDWVQARARAIEAARVYRESRPEFRVTKMAHNPFVPRGELVGSPEAARRLFMEQLSAHSGQDADRGSYGNKHGEFFLGGLTLYAAIYGREKSFLGDADAPCVYAVFKDDGADWYAKALDIVAETCDFVLAQTDPQAYSLAWSG